MTTLRTAVLVLVWATSTVSADVYTYECGVLPTSAGFILLQAFCGCPPEPCEGTQWIEDGNLFQQNGLCEGYSGANFVSHQHLIDQESTPGAWFAEWKMFTDGSSDEIPSVAPASVVISDGNALTYHFTIADDTVRFIRDLALPIVFFDVEPGVAHTYRLELYGQDLDETYLFFIDGQLLDSGIPEGPLFNQVWGAKVNFRSKAVLVPSIANWSYFRWGELQDPGSADFTLNGEVGFEDLPFFQECLTTEAGGWAGCTWADMDFDSDTDCDDWPLFLAAWTDPADPPAMPECDCAPADLDCNGSVSAFDLALLLGSWGPCPEPPANCPADLDASGFVNAFDLATLLGSWG
ncbi:MAG: hypothetical protein O7D91_18885 [Planctomycetota bacterium]|nr:hypothetical protein [Planctomycetota bacterium]